MYILGIESSCDETAIAVINERNEVLSSQVTTQTNHKEFGGIIPELAARQHLTNILPLFAAALAEAQITPEDIDLICVTQGPGLIGSLLVGAAFAKALSLSLGKPLVPVNHVHAHIHGAFLNRPNTQGHFPAIGLVVSGGHTNLYLMQNPWDFQLIGSTKDDACGESFDKVARMMGLGYPGGPKIEKLATSGNPNRFPFPKMMAKNKKAELSFSYSGLKTFVSYFIKNHGELTQQDKADLAAGFQQEAIHQLIRKIELAIDVIRADSDQKAPIRSIIVAGGVSCNQHFRQEYQKILPLPLIFPEIQYCCDNAAMIAALGWQIFQQQQSETPSATNWEAFSRYEFFTDSLENANGKRG